MTARKLAIILLLLAGLYALTTSMAGPGVKGASTPHRQPVGQLTIDNRHSNGPDRLTDVNAVNGASHSIQAMPALTGAQIDVILCGQQSPACGTGSSMYEEGRNSNIDSDYALAFFAHESQYGKFGIARINRGLGNIRCTPGYNCINGFRAYSSWQAGYHDWYLLINWYITVLHKSTVEAIVPTYAPTSENDTSAYILAVVTSVQGWQKKVK